MQLRNDPYQDMTAAGLVHALDEGRRLRAEAVRKAGVTLARWLAAPVRRLLHGPRRLPVLRMG